MTSHSSAASHTSAGRLHRYTYVAASNAVHIIRAHGDAHEPAGVVLHQTRLLPADHLCTKHGIAVTTPARTVFDLAGSTNLARLRRIVDDQLASDRVDLTALELVHRELAKRGRRGSRELGTILDERRGRYIPPESELETRFAALCAHAKLPTPVRQLRLPWAPDDGNRSGRVDVAFVDQRVIVELDSWRHHSSMAAFEQDRRRDQLATAAGWRPLRFTWRQITQDPTHVITILRTVLEGFGPL